MKKKTQPLSYPMDLDDLPEGAELLGRPKQQVPALLMIIKKLTKTKDEEDEDEDEEEETGEAPKKKSSPAPRVLILRR